MPGNFVTIKGLKFRFNDRWIFDDVDLEIPKGKITAVMGPSGTGKTTLLRLIGGQLCPEVGTIDVDGDNIHDLSRKNLYRVRKKMGMLFQIGALFSNLNVFDNVAFPLREHTNLTEEMIRALVLIKLEAVGLRGAADLMTSELSGGMSRRVALARAIALDPQMIMYDEPLTGQDPITMGVLVQLIKMLNDNLGLTSIIVSHDVKEIASIADYVYLLSDGKVIAHDIPEALFHSDEPHAKQFMQGLPDGPVPFHYPSIDLEKELFSERKS